MANASQPERDLIAALKTENARLVALLEQHGIDWRRPSVPLPAPAAPLQEPAPARLSTAGKVALFRQLFRGRTDVYPVRWENRAGDRSGYTPACANEWRPGVCAKPTIKCADCAHRQLLPLDDAVVHDHLAGRHTIGVYPLLQDDSCHFLAVDFDEAEWREDARAFVGSCRELGVPAALEISRSGQGAHAWVFFAGRVAARDARRLGTALISHACSRTHQLQLSSYDRLFPNQDTLPKGGFGNLIALPLQKFCREHGCSVFADDELRPHVDQWAFLACVERMAPLDIEPVILRATGGAHPLDVTFIEDEDLATPWQRPAPGGRLAGPMPEALTLTLANQIYVEKAALPQALANRLIRLAAFQNPEFYRAQAMRLSVWDKPRVIGCAQNFPRHIGLPRGCLDGVLALLRDNGIRCDLHDERQGGTPIDASFAGLLRPDQEAAVSAMLRHDTGVLCAPTAFGKTVSAAALIARRGVNTLVLVHRTELLRQWQERLQAFLGVERKSVGVIGCGKDRPTGRIDVAVMQSLYRQGKADERVAQYGHIIVDECHHVGAASFEALLRHVKARYVLGLTATPIRRDGQQPVLFMQCGPVRHTAQRPVEAPQDLAVIPRYLSSRLDVAADAAIQEVFRRVACDAPRTDAIAAEVQAACQQGRKVLVLTERTDHLDAMAARLVDCAAPLFVLHGRISRKDRSALLDALDALPPDAARVLLATGRLVGEGFDHPPLDTLVLAMPVSWKGTLQQYAGRLHREHIAKASVQIIDFVDEGHPALLRMWDRRQRGYKAMGYRITESGSLPTDRTMQAVLEYGTSGQPP
ncbi:TOTE conflict system archaeo-eukaryotic primase domain-containing protein [Azohydromonas aeria]|uniref:TOTE conflict system archaeo-eukaryotic primase domain-containing protein n=1 Tax=Azohydromonas aeria TaxID=2590212 RepID=UPI0012F7871D|nr:DEAD/DEAH box helicase family protein [Azohydromonas aeria]